MWVTSRYASGFAFEIEVMGSLLALNAVIIGIQVDAWLLSAPGAQGAQGPSDGPVGCPSQDLVSNEASPYLRSGCVGAGSRRGG